MDIFGRRTLGKLCFARRLNEALGISMVESTEARPASKSNVLGNQALLSPDPTSQVAPFSKLDRSGGWDQNDGSRDKALCPGFRCSSASAFLRGGEKVALLVG